MCPEWVRKDYVDYVRQHSTRTRIPVMIIQTTLASVTLIGALATPKFNPFS